MTIELEENPLIPPQPAQTPLIAVENLTKRYGRFKAVDNISFAVPPGSIFGFIGPNGAGKTTTIKILATLLEPSDGQATIAGYDVVRQASRVRDVIGYMPDFFGVYDDLTVLEYLEFYARTQGVGSGKRTKLLNDLLELVELGYKRDAYVETLSRGMKQRLCLARCLVHDPQVLLLDEPASGLDPRARVEMRELLKELQRMGKTILVSSHILPELAELCSHIGIIDRGHFLAGGPVEDILRLYARRQTLRIKFSSVADDTEPNPPIKTETEGYKLLDDPEKGAVPESAMILAASDFEQTATILKKELALAPESELKADPQRGEVWVDFGGGEGELRRTLAALIQAGLPVTQFTVERSNLEDIFMSVTENTAPPDEQDAARRRKEDKLERGRRERRQK